jgi:hypothetical protein
MPTTSWRPGKLPLPDHLSILMQNLKVQQRRWPRVSGFPSPSLAAQRMPAQPNPKRQSVRLGILLRRREQPALGPLDAGRFNQVNRRRDSFHCVALATLEHAVLESSDAGVYTLQIHAFPTGRAARTFGRRQLRQSASHGCTPSQLRLYEYIQDDVGVYTVSDWNSTAIAANVAASGPRPRYLTSARRFATCGPGYSAGAVGRMTVGATPTIAIATATSDLASGLRAPAIARASPTSSFRKGVDW